jgi:hypothetical protein
VAALEAEHGNLLLVKQDLLQISSEGAEIAEAVRVLTLQRDQLGRELA